MEAFTIAEDKAQGVPAGAYTGKFLGYRETETKNGPTLVWEWVITQGEYEGKTASAFSDPPSKTVPTAKNALGRLLAGLAGGKPLTGGDVIHPATCVGKLYMLVVAPGPKGGAACVRTVVPAQ